MENLYDVVIIGAGPIGLAAACAAQDANLHYLVLDKSGLCQTIVEWAPRQSFFSPAQELEIGGLPFYIGSDDKPRREDALAYYRAVVSSRKLNLHTWERAVSVHRGTDGLFVITTVQQPDDAWQRDYISRHVVLTSGVWDQPLGLSVPGAELKKVSRRYLDPTPYYDKDCLVVGGGNSAAEVAMALAHAGARAQMALIEASVDDCMFRPFVRREISMMNEEKRLTLHFSTKVTAITTDTVTLQTMDSTNPWTINNDFVFTMIGATPDLPFLRDAGIHINPNDQKPCYDTETFETNIPGLYVAGSLARNQHIVNGRARAVGIIQRIAAAKS